MMNASERQQHLDVLMGLSERLALERTAPTPERLALTRFNAAVDHVLQDPVVRHQIKLAGMRLVGALR